MVELGYAERGRAARAGGGLALRRVAATWRRSARILADAGLDGVRPAHPAGLAAGSEARARRAAARRRLAVADADELLREARRDAGDLRGAGLAARRLPRPGRTRSSRRLAATIERLAGEPIAATGVDGCGAPVAAISLTALARSYSKAVQGDASTPERMVADAMRAHPEYVGGTERDVTLLMSGIPGLLAKDGAEGVYAVALGDGRAMALKVDDGADRPRPLVVAAVLRQLGVDARVLDRFDSLDLLGGGVPVGSVRVPQALLH